MALSSAQTDRLFLAAVLVAGLVAMLMVARPTRQADSWPVDGVVASVNGVEISRAAHERALGALRTDRTGPEQPTDAQHVLDRLIDEELLVQHALSLDLARADPRARADLTAAALAVVAASAERREPTAEELSAFYVDQRARFVSPVRVHIEQHFVGAEHQVVGVAALLAIPATTPPVPPPGGALGRRQLVRSFGATAAEALLEAQPGPATEWLGPFRHDGGQSVVRVVGRSGGAPAPLDAVRDEVLALYRRTQADRAVRAFLDGRRQSADVRLSLPAGAP